MKKIVQDYYWLVAILFIFSCNGPEKHTAAPELLKGRHPLLKMATRTAISSVSEGSGTGSFFFLFGSASQYEKTTNKSEEVVTFCWQGVDSIYTISEIPIQRIRVSRDSTVVAPYVIFSHFKNEGWSSNGSKHVSSDYNHNGNPVCECWVYKEVQKVADQGSISEKFNTFVDEVTIVCRPSDWEMRVELPLEKPKN